MLVSEYTGTLKIADVELECAVLNDGRRIIKHSDVFKALGREVRGNARLPDTPSFMDAKNLQPYISNELNDVKEKILYKDENGKIFQGFDAIIIPLVCELYILADEAGAVTYKNQKDTAMQASIIIRSLAKVGIVALVDEATGYQNIRKAEALQEILNLYITKDLLAWTKTFPDEFYEQIFRLKGWKWSTFNRPGVVGKYTNDVVYDRMAVGLVNELKTLNPRDEKGLAKHRDHQHLSENQGRKALEMHLHAVIGLMRASDSWEEFMYSVNKAYPKKGSIEDLFPETLNPKNLN
ncbi:P63C domain-containing protein [Psychrobacter sp. KCTC 72983]|uniref:P63C domain-containing protein n=1 Tax=Psychrobacter sp. KCTC 72983 TaxID=2733866 RepID=UPI0016479549|nr:P63C domain-containing protein [Psychrobacter sp. KCTC 72983]